MAAANRVIPLTCSGHTRPVVHLSFSSPQEDPNSPFLLASSCKDGNPMLRNWNGDWLGTFIGHKGAVWSTKLSRDTSRAATGSADFSARIWDTYSGSVLASFPHNHIVRTVAISPSASHLLTAGNEKKIRLFDLTNPEKDPVLMKNKGGELVHEGVIRSIIWDAERAVGVSASEDKTIRWWDLKAQSEIHSVTLPEPIHSMELSIPRDTLVVAAGKDVSFIPLVPNAFETHTVHLTHPVSSASIHPILGDRFAAGSTADPWVHVYDYEKGEEREVYKGHHGPVHCVEYSPDGEMYATGSEDGTIRLWQTNPGTSYGLWQGNEG